MLVEGAAIGGGLGLACVADVTLVTADARFRLSETSLGYSSGADSALCHRACGPDSGAAADADWCAL